MGHKISKEQIDPGVKDHIMSFVGDVADLETEVNTDIISAVNSLMVDRVDNAENMGKLANAIGEPVTANHSVDEVVEGLGEMLSTFKTNMMNSGVMVESGDKFKALIDKIKGLTEGEGNKGIQMTSGVINVKTSFPMGSYKSLDKSTNKSLRKLTIDCGFIPNLVIATTNLGGTMDFSAYIGGLGNENSFYSGSGGRNISGSGSLYPLSSEGFVNNSIVDLPVSLYGDYTYYAIGVGEEDTTLRDSLASILQEEGVSVTEEDDMASLIGKVDSEFDRKNEEMENNKGLDIISATELPATGKENQICVITDNPVDNFVITPYDTVSNDSSIITLYTSSAADGDTVIPITSGNITNYYHVYKIRQNAIPLSSYYYNNGWIKLTSGEFIILDSYGMYNDTPFGTITNNGALFQQGYGYKLEVSSSYDSYLIQTQTVDLTNYSKIKVIISEPSDETSYFGAKNHYLGLANSNKVYPLSGYGRSFSGKGTYEVDITNYTGLGSVIVAVWNSGSGDYSCFNVSLITIE